MLIASTFSTKVMNTIAEVAIANSGGGMPDLKAVFDEFDADGRSGTPRSAALKAQTLTPPKSHDA